jgi:large subunit ribosomal protein L31
MKSNIHPEYHKIKIVMTDGSDYETYTTYGKEGDVMRLDIDPKSHPAWTGGERKVMEKGQLSKFEKRFAGFGAAGGAAKADAKADVKKEDKKGK